MRSATTCSISRQSKFSWSIDEVPGGGLKARATRTRYVLLQAAAFSNSNFF